MRQVLMVQITTVHHPLYHLRTCAFVLAIDLCLGGQGAVLQAVGLVAHFDDVAVVSQPI